MRKRFFICFVGIDGSGKSTLSKQLVHSLKENGIETNYVWNRYIPILMKLPMIIANKVVFKKNEIYENYSVYSSKKKALFSNNFLSIIYENMLMFDYVIQMIYKVKVPLLLGKSIVCDRFIFDTIISDLAVDLNYSETKTISFLNKYLKISPKPDIIFLIDAPEEIAFMRKNDTPSIEYLKERRKICLLLEKPFNMVYIDGTRNIGELNNKILYNVLNYLRGDLYE